MDNNLINDSVRQVRLNNLTYEAIISEVAKTINVLSNYGIKKINLRSLGSKNSKNQVCQIDNFDASVVVSNDVKWAHYTTFNVINSDIENGNRAIKDSDISEYRFMLIDIDPERPSGTCATETEKKISH